MKKKKWLQILNIALLIQWFITGILIMIDGEISVWNYGACWFCLLLVIVEVIIDNRLIDFYRERTTDLLNVLGKVREELFKLENHR